MVAGIVTDDSGSEVEAGVSSSMIPDCEVNENKSECSA